jgi:hypothetical protein
MIIDIVNEISASHFLSGTRKCHTKTLALIVSPIKTSSCKSCSVTDYPSFKVVLVRPFEFFDEFA